METKIHILLERLSSLYKSQMRQAASTQGLALVHLEIIQYLDTCNKYSNTAQAISEYLGQTKGSISQSLKVLEGKGLVVKTPSALDKRAVHLQLTADGKGLLEKMVLDYMPKFDGPVEMLQNVIKDWQSQLGSSGYGQCNTCIYNKKLDDNTYYCNLVKAPLTSEDIDKICKEHQYN